MKPPHWQALRMRPAAATLSGEAITTLCTIVAAAQTIVAGASTSAGVRWLPAAASAIVASFLSAIDILAYKIQRFA